MMSAALIMGNLWDIIKIEVIDKTTNRKLLENSVKKDVISNGKKQKNREKTH